MFAFDDRVRFETNHHVLIVDYATVGELVIPVDESAPEESRPAWLVDGQDATVQPSVTPIWQSSPGGCLFIAMARRRQRSQFILVNNTKPLPKGLIHELLPNTTGDLPPVQPPEELPAQIMTRLNSGPRNQRGTPLPVGLQRPPSLTERFKTTASSG